LAKPGSPLIERDRRAPGGRVPQVGGEATPTVRAKINTIDYTDTAAIRSVQYQNANEARFAVEDTMESILDWNTTEKHHSPVWFNVGFEGEAPRPVQAARCSPLGALPSLCPAGERPYSTNQHPCTL